MLRWRVALEEPEEVPFTRLRRRHTPADQVDPAQPCRSRRNSGRRCNAVSRSALGNTPVSECLPFDRVADGQVTVDELVRGVRNALS